MGSSDIGNLPECALVRTLKSRARERHDVDFDFLGTLERLRKRVSAEVSQINVLFPEFTPHDEQYHLKNLFHVADKVLRPDSLAKMNAAELFVLAAGLYGHDWGMAVSEPEKEYITTGRIPDGTPAGVLSTLPDEHIRFQAFARKHGLAVNEDGQITDLPVELWREYVRETHAFRSGARVRKFFEPEGGGVGEAVGRVCEGHWLDFEELQNFHAYPMDFSVLSEVVNLRALSVYVRLIDLLDIADDRTPYVLWKFVAPRDSTSKMEWAKHAALQPITCPDYQSGRIILVDGSTDDHEVYAALEDLRVWCEDQLRGCNDTLAQMNDDRHRLDIFHIHWRVAARGFKPVSIQFEFDRGRMFEILGDDIYQGDPYVFLRELLQNSIDAIRTRREVLKRHGIVPENFGAIHVTVEHGKNGDAVITWRDDGIGMDEFVVRNYLAIAGKSYYHSEAFEREGLNIDPISRFGIGILSCFMVADELHIETFRDPYMPGDGQPLRIKIPAPKKQFRIETLPTETASPGTTVKVFVKGKKLPKESNEEGAKPEPLDVTQYLSIVAGFVEFPIVITEGDRKTIVLHPYQDAEAARSRFGADFEVHQLELSYPWEQVFVPQDLQAAREVFEEHALDMHDNLALEGYEGKLLLLFPCAEFDVRENSYEARDIRSVSAYRKDSPDAPEVQVRHLSDFKLNSPLGLLARSAKRGFESSVYRDGILLPNANQPVWLDRHRSLIIPRMVVNLPKSETRRVDLARTMIRDEDLGWDVPIWNKILERHFDPQIDRLCSLDPSERLLATARVLASDIIRVGELWERFPTERWPMFEVSPDGVFRLTEVAALGDRPLYSTPLELQHVVESALSSYPQTTEVDRSIMARWKGGSFHFKGDSYASSLLGASISSLTREAVSRTHVHAATRFLAGPSKDGPPIAQTVYIPAQTGDTELVLDALVEIGAVDPAQLKLADLRRMTSELLPWGRDITAFEPPYQHCYAYGDAFLNSRHLIVQLQIRVACALRLARASGEISAVNAGRMGDRLKATSVKREEPVKRLSQRLREALDLARSLGLVDIDIDSIPFPQSDDFVTGTIVEQDGERKVLRTAMLKYVLRHSKKDSSEFGMPLS